MGKRYRYTGPKRSEPGRTRRMLAEVLFREIDYGVDPDSIRTNHNRRVEDDECRWEAFGHFRDMGPNIRQSVFSYSTMKECVRHGVALLDNFQVEANI